MPLYPLFLDLAGRRCLVVGAGPVGQRKAAGLLEAGARVRIVAPGGVEQVSNLSRRGAVDPLAAGQVGNLSHAAEIEWILGEYSPEHLDGMALVFAAAPPGVNARVVADARARGLWVNSASDPETGDFVVPAVRADRQIQIAVGTKGSSPTLAAKIADKAIKELDHEWFVLADMHFLLRDEIKRRVPKAARADLWERLTDPAWLQRLRTGPRTVVFNEMRALVDRAAGS